MKKGIVVVLLITGILLNSCTLFENGTFHSKVTLGTSLPASTKPAVSPTPTHLPTATSEVFPFATMTEQDYKYELTEMAKFPVKCDNPHNYLFSPDHNWLAWACPYAYKEGNQTLEIAALRGNEWILQSRDYYTDEFKLVYGKDQTNILNLQTNEVYPIHNGMSRGFTWSQDSSKVVYVQDNSNLTLYSPETKELSTLVSEEGWCLNIFPYEDRIRIDLINEKDWSTREDEFSFDWTTGIIIQTTQTPTP